MKIFLLIIIYFALTVLFIQDCQCQVWEEWHVHYIGPYNPDFPFAMVADVSGNVYVTGYSKRASSIWDYATVKYNTSGAQEWAARYNWPGITSNSGAIAFSIAIDKSGNVYVTGTAPINSSGNPVKTTTVKYNSIGVQQWVAIFYGQLNNVNDLDGGQSVAVDDSGYVYVAACSYWPDYINWIYTTIKYNSSGVQQWCTPYIGPGNGKNKPCRIAVDNSDNVYVTGYSMGDTTYNDIATVKYNSIGRQQWVARYNGPSNGGDSATDMKVDNFGNVYVTGASRGKNTKYDYITIKYNSNGMQQWASRYKGTETNNASASNVAESIGLDNLGNVYVTGFSHNYPDSGYCTTIKYNLSGIQQWVANYDYEGFGSMGVALVLDKYGYIYVSASSSEGSRDHFATIKYSPEGVKQWAIVSNVNPYGEEPVAIALDSLDNVYVSGRDGNYLTIKYDQLVGVKPVSNLIPNEFKLYQNYPNPFNPTSKIKFDISKESKVSIKIYDILGREVITLINELKQAGYYESIFDGSKYASGVYFYRFEAKDLNSGQTFVSVKKMVILK